MRPAKDIILHISSSLGLGGTEKTMQLFVSHLDRSRFVPVVYSFEDGPRRPMLSAQGIDTYVGGDLLALLQRLNPSIVHLHRAGWPDPKLLRLLRLANVPAVVETNVFGRFDPSPQAAIIDRHLFVSNFCRQRYQATNRIDTSGSRYRVVYNPVDTDRIADHTGARDWNAKVIGRISRPDPGKWSSLALDFMPLLNTLVPDFSYHIIGATPEAYEFTKRHGLESNVNFCEAVAGDEELAVFLDSVSVLAHANDTGESFGLVIAEAMAAGLPVVTHPCQGLKDNAQLELVDDGKTGIIAQTADDYAYALARLLLDPMLAQRMGKAGQEKAKQLYRAQTVTRKLESIYTELLTPANEDAAHDASNAPHSSVHLRSAAL